MKIAKIVIFKVDYLNFIEIYRGVSKFLCVHTKSRKLFVHDNVDENENHPRELNFCTSINFSMYMIIWVNLVN